GTQPKSLNHEQCNATVKRRDAEPRGQWASLEDGWDAVRAHITPVCIDRGGGGRGTGKLVHGRPHASVPPGRAFPRRAGPTRRGAARIAVSRDRVAGDSSA